MEQAVSSAHAPHASVTVHPDNNEQHIYTVGIAGPGRAGTALATYLRRNKRVQIVGCALGSPAHQQRFLARNPHAVIVDTAHELYTMCNTIIIAVADNALQDVCESMVASLSQTATHTQAAAHTHIAPVILHLSGATSAQVLESAHRIGASIGALHPIQAISTIATESNDSAIQTFAPATFTIQGDSEAEHRAHALLDPLGNTVLPIDSHHKALYHAATSVAANLSMALFQSAVLMLEECGFDDDAARSALAPLIITNAQSWAERGMAALTGPVSRGDWGTVRTHMQTIQQLIVQLQNTQYTEPADTHTQSQPTSHEHAPAYTQQAVSRLLHIYELLTEQLQDLYLTRIH